MNQETQSVVEAPLLQAYDNQSLSLADATRQLVKQLLENSNKNDITNLREKVLAQMEPPLLQAAMEKCKFNQKRAADLLGISRGTCRSLLIKYFGEKYCGNRQSK